MAINTVVENYGINKVGYIGNESVQKSGEPEKQISFAEYLNNAIDEVNQLQLESEKLGVEFAAGRTDNIHQVMIAAEKADIALQFTMQVRNKILDAYNEIMRMQI